MSHQAHVDLYGNASRDAATQEEIDLALGELLLSSPFCTSLLQTPQNNVALPESEKTIRVALYQAAVLSTFCCANQQETILVAFLYVNKYIRKNTHLLCHILA